MSLHIPALRLGRNYESLDKVEVKDCRAGEVRANVSVVNAGIIRKDLTKIAGSRDALRKFSHRQLIEMSKRAADLFLTAELAGMSAQQYLETLSSTSGLPHVMVRRNMNRIHGMMSNMDAVLRGLTRGLDLDDTGSPYHFFPATSCLGLVMPSNSPAVNSLWLPAIALKIPVIIKPGKDEPWTPYRLVQAFMAAGVPAEAFGFYPTDHEGANAIMTGCGRALIFGDKSTTDKYAGNPAVQVHGPGYSKILIGEDQIERWPEFIEVMCDSIAANGGRSCLNASAIVVPSHGDEIAEALAKRLGPIVPLPVTDQNARLSAFANVKMAEFIQAAIEEGLKTPGAVDVTAKYRDGARLVNFEGGTYLRPTIVRCDSFQHPLANKEYLFAYASVVEIPPSKMLEQIGPSLVVTAITNDEPFIQKLMESPVIDRLNIGAISTMTISWDQPHEGNLFELLYKRRAFERK
jgi:acyl-CoA reductase-like NAD-dependent aldehyde dehydrogenase